MGCRVCQRPSRAGDVITIPVNLAIPNSSPLFSEVSYQYIPVTDFSPGFSHIAATGKELSDEMYMSPRITRGLRRQSLQLTPFTTGLLRSAARLRI